LKKARTKMRTGTSLMTTKLKAIIFFDVLDVLDVLDVWEDA